jgi:formylglycine-generating enzyme required for sulfatase activity
MSDHRPSTIDHSFPASLLATWFFSAWLVLVSSCAQRDVVTLDAQESDLRTDLVGGPDAEVVGPETMPGDVREILPEEPAGDLDVADRPDLDLAEAVDEATPDPCEGIDCGQHGKCLPDGKGGHFCDCDDGWTADADTCIEDPCAGQSCSDHGVCKLDEELQPLCECFPDFVAEGLACVPEKPGDPCAGQDCSGHGQCVDLQGVAACKCDDGFEAVGLACVVPQAAQPEVECKHGPLGNGQIVCLASDSPYKKKAGVAINAGLPTENLPEKVDHAADYLDLFCPVVSDQGACGWCVAHAVTQAIEALKCKQQLPAKLVSEPHLWFAGGKDVADCAGGWYVPVALAAAQAAWLVPEDVWPYSGLDGLATEYTADEIGVDVLAAEGQFRITDFEGVDNFSVASLKAALAAGHNVVYAVPVFWYKGWTKYFDERWDNGDIEFGSPDPSVPKCTYATNYMALDTCRCDADEDCPANPWGDSLSCWRGRCADGFHAILITGYDDSGPGWFQFRNSWGQGWGDGGYGRFTYAYAKSFGYGGAYPVALQPQCAPHKLAQCFNGDISWFDSCGNAEEVKTDCPDGCEPGADLCSEIPCQCKAVAGCCTDGCHLDEAGTACGPCRECDAQGYCSVQLDDDTPCGPDGQGWTCQAGDCVEPPPACGDVAYVGCCDGPTLKWCQDDELHEVDCSSIPYCGWNDDASFYTCSTGGAADPSGKNPKTCPDGCQPQCAGKFCGPDGCGGVCGKCGAGLACTAQGKCQACTPQCAGKECGPDGCGGVCGSGKCKKGSQCSPAGKCESLPECKPGKEIGCSQTLVGLTSGKVSQIDKYLCSDWAETGPEEVYTFVPDFSGKVLLTVLSLGPVEPDGGLPDFDLFLLEGHCGPDACVAFGDSELPVDVIAGTTYYVVVDGYAKSAGSFELTLTCQDSLCSCKGKECGEDGCGGTCGTCPEAAVCSKAGKCHSGPGCEESGSPTCDGCLCEQCVCQIDPYCCEHKWDELCIGECINDCEGCGKDEKCGNGLCEAATAENCSNCPDDCGCQGGQVCFQLACCSPACVGKQCGSDGCGGDCGACPQDYLCQPDGTCAADCQQVCAGVECGAAGLEKECDCGQACDDGIDCTDDSCNGNACVHAPDDAGCQDDNACTLAVCLPDGCKLIPLIGHPCDDGNPCTSLDSCIAGAEAPACQGVAVVCDDGNACTDDQCDPVLGCTAVPNTAACADDGNPCTADICADGECAHPPLPALPTVACDDQDLCTAAGHCADGACQPGTPLPIPSDDNPCTMDWCESSEGPQYAPFPDGLACEAAGVCLGECSQGTCTDVSMEECDGQDNTCDGVTDEGFADADGDKIADCIDPDDDGDGVADAQDCEPLDKAIFPGQQEVCNNGGDDDCDQLADSFDPDCPGTLEADPYLPLDALDAGIFKDATGNGRDGTAVNGVSTVPGKAGGAALFDGKDDFVRLPDPNTLSHGKARSVSLWFKAPASPRKRTLFAQEDYRDLNDDGWPDVVFANGSFYYGSANGFGAAGFSLATNGGSGVTSADLDVNGQLDLVFSNQTKGGGKIDLDSYVYLASGQGYGSPLPLPTNGVYGNSVADLDLDGRLDIVFSNSMNEQGGTQIPSFVYWGQATAPLFKSTMKLALPAFAALGNAVADVDGSGTPDVAFANGQGNEGYLYLDPALNQATPKLVKLSTYTALGVRMADLDGNGYVDLVFANDNNGASKATDSFLYFQTAAGFSPTPAKLPTVGANDAAVADLDGDGFLDIVFSGYQSDSSYETESLVYWGSATGFHVDERTGLPTKACAGCVAGDFNRDGHLDLLFSCSAVGSRLIFWGDGSRFQDGGFTTMETAGPAGGATLPGAPLGNASATMGTQPSDHGSFQLLLQGGKVLFRLDDANGQRHAVTSDKAYAADAWNHVAAGYDVDNKALVLYVNGVKAGELTDKTFSMGKTWPWRIRVGSDAENQDKFLGALDEIRVYDRLLSPAEAKTLYDKPKPPDPPLPVCESEVCGWDLYGHFCGTCEAGYACNFDGQCEWKGFVCGTTTCPELPGYTVSCTAAKRCEYVQPNASGWMKHDVWLYVPPGTFQMGADGEPGQGTDEKPVHSVTIPNGYFIAKYEGTVSQYEACMTEGKCTAPSTADWDGDGWGVNKSKGSAAPVTERPDHPQNGLTWQQGKDFCGWSAPAGRLPTEAEWEYAATGPTHRKYPWGDAPEPTCSNNTAVFDGDDDTEKPWGCKACIEKACSGTMPVGTKPAGAAWSGALDMAGNVWEWCEDNHHVTYEGAPSDGQAWIDPASSTRVTRSGAFNGYLRNLRSASRNYAPPANSGAHSGVRCVRPVPVTCGGTLCPEVPGYKLTCNPQAHCEYSPANPTGWRKWDVWIYIPPGSFKMGSPEDEPGHLANEQPVHEVTITDGYLVAKYEIVTEQYDACQKTGKCSAPSTADYDAEGWGLNTIEKGRHAHPQNGLQWQQAIDFCGWTTPGGRLPSEAEWEFAASGPTHRKYPWGDAPEPICSKGTSVFNEDGQAGRPWACNPCTTQGCSGTSAVGSMPLGASWSGALDMGGNIYEWVQDWQHTSYIGAPADGSAWAVGEPGQPLHRVVRGGGFASLAQRLRTAWRGGSPPELRDAAYGARCVRPVVTPFNCGGDVCPEMDGYDRYCNPQNHCEYANKDKIGWKKWDVWIWIPPGILQMGSPDNEGGHQSNESPVHPVTFAKGYFIGKYEIVVEQYQACNGADAAKCTTPSTVDWSGDGWGTNYWKDGTDPKDGANLFHKRPEHPQNGLTWQQAKDFCGWSAPAGRLPSEAEWEYAAKGPVHRKYPWGNSPDPTCSNNTAVFDGDDDTKKPWGCNACNEKACSGTMPVGSKPAGVAWSGALDMSGNVWEWNEDWYHNTFAGAPADGSAWVDVGSYRVIRGGSFDYEAVSMRSARRGPDTPDSRDASVGGRCVRSLE